MYKGIQSEVISTTRFDGNLVLSAAYLDRSDIISTSKIRAEERFFLYLNKGIW